MASLKQAPLEWVTNPKGVQRDLSTSFAPHPSSC